ncbi:MAG: arsenate reductase ArsC [Candidatus Thalassarchaeaceae archaeon]|nr:arsenate reductase ArsC [Candidatus Thalassarchaeaceae archaeon]
MNILFVCVGNSCRSQMAEGIARSLGHTVSSAGTHPALSVNFNAIIACEEIGIDISKQIPKSVDGFSAQDFDLVISMGCGVSCPTMRIDQDWELEDPVGQPVEVYRKTRDEIQRRLESLV